MNVRTFALCGLAAVLGLGTIGVAAQTGSPAVPPAGLGARRMGAERHPEMKAALHALRNAKMRLEKANTDFGGHRAKALEHTNDAISEVEAALAFDKK